MSVTKLQREMKSTSDTRVTQELSPHRRPRQNGQNETSLHMKELTGKFFYAIFQLNETSSSDFCSKFSTAFVQILHLCCLNAFLCAGGLNSNTQIRACSHVLSCLLITFIFVLCISIIYCNISYITGVK